MDTEPRINGAGPSEEIVPPQSPTPPTRSKGKPRRRLLILILTVILVVTGSVILVGSVVFQQYEPLEAVVLESTLSIGGCGGGFFDTEQVPAETPRDKGSDGDPDSLAKRNQLQH